MSNINLSLPRSSHERTTVFWCTRHRLHLCEASVSNFTRNKSPPWGTHFCTIKLKIPLLHGVCNRRSVGKFKQVQLPRCVKIARGGSNSLGRTQQIKNKSLTTWSESRSHYSSIMHSLSDSARAGRQSGMWSETNHWLLAPKTRTNSAPRTQDEKIRIRTSIHVRLW